MQSLDGLWLVLDYIIVFQNTLKILVVDIKLFILKKLKLHILCLTFETIFFYDKTFKTIIKTLTKKNRKINCQYIRNNILLVNVLAKSTIIVLGFVLYWSCL